MPPSDRVFDKLRCPACAARVAIDTETSLSCTQCIRRYPVTDDIVDFLVDSSLNTKLEQIDYDKIGNISDASIHAVGRSWSTVIGNSGLDITGKTVLEIGSGTGLLTIGLLKNSALQQLYAVDISRVFLHKTLSRAGGDGRLTAIRCDCNQLPFAHGSIDLILGRSILHHLIDYADVIRQCSDILSADGRAIFFEPILNGKIIIAFYLALICEISQNTADNNFDSRDLNIMNATIKHITKEKWYPQDRNSLSKIEDKFIFSSERMRALGIKSGFRQVDILRDERVIDNSYWSYFVNNMKMAGLATERLEKYRYIAEAFRKSIGLFPDIFSEPMIYFCFHK